MMKSFTICLCLMLAFSISGWSQPLNKKKEKTRQDTLRGSDGPERTWWDVQQYHVEVTPDYLTRTIKGKTTISYKIVQDRHSDYMQIDLQKPLLIDSIFYNHKLYINYPGKPYFNEGNVWHIPLPPASKNSMQELTIVYHGQPRQAIRPPWDGGWIWTKDREGNAWMSVACQGLGASVWYPCKDYQGDEPDNGATLTVTVADSMKVAGNGRMLNSSSANGLTTTTWQVKNPINNYDLIPYIGQYTNWSDTLNGEKGTLDLNFWVIRADEQQARQQFVQVKQMLRAFEYWFGPYPFYEDGYKLVQAPHLGMEHQSAVAYGNKFKNGYLGNDLSGSGWGLKWDYIIVHESGHEWFGNNITTKDIADMWVHEGFTDYAETLFTEYYYGKEAGNAYTQGLRKNIQNDMPIIGKYGVNQEGSGDMYYKGSNMIHTIRQVINNDEVFRQILRGLNKTFYHQTVTTKQVEDYISKTSGIDLSKIFDQYLRTTKIPVLEYKTSNGKTSFRWSNVVEGFHMPVKLTDGTWLKPTEAWQQMSKGTVPEPDPNFYIMVKKAK